MKPVGLARLISVPDPEPFVTHRGKGAFSESEFTVASNGCHEAKSPGAEDKKKLNFDPAVKETLPKKTMPGKGSEIKILTLENGQKKNGDKKPVVTQPIGSSNISSSSSSYRALQAMIRQCSRDDTDEVVEGNVYNNDDIADGERMARALNGSSVSKRHDDGTVNGLGNSSALRGSSGMSGDGGGVGPAVSKLNGSPSPGKVTSTNANTWSADEVFFSVSYLKKEVVGTGPVGNVVGDQCNGSAKVEDQIGTNPFEEDQDYEEIKHVPITEL